MLYCINPKCNDRENLDNATNCPNCGTQLLVNNRYKLIQPLRELSGDYFTDIFLVEDMGLSPEDWGTQKVLKVLKYNNNDELVRLFKQEAMTLMWLKNPGMPQVEPDGYFTINTTRPAQSLHCLVMEYIEGDNLEELVAKKGAIDEAQAINWLTQLVDILDLLHQRNFAHRDIKPSNVILRPNGKLTLIDFGTVGVGKLGDKTVGSTKVGSIGYAAPEQLNGSSELGSDLFSLGRTLVHLLTGKTPVELETYQTAKELDLSLWTSVRTSVDILLSLAFNKKPLDLQNQKAKKKLAWRYHVRNGISDYLGDLIDDLMADEVSDRPKNTTEVQRKLRFTPEEIVRQKVAHRLFTAGVVLSGIGIFAIAGTPIMGTFARHLNFALGNSIDRSLQNLGTDKFIEKELGSAKSFYEAALFFNPNNQAASYSLGRVCEQTNQIPCAMEKYRKVIQSDTNILARAAAISSLTRLQIIYQQPVDPSLIHKALATIQEEELTLDPSQKDSKIPASLHKNLGWWQLQSNQLVDAEKSLKTSIKLNPDRPAAYCLLAQLLEINKQPDTALKQWAECNKLVNESSPSEELQWTGIARQRLTAKDPNCKPNSIQPKDSKN